MGDGFSGPGVYRENTITQGAGSASSDGFQVDYSVVTGNTISEHEGDGVVGRGNLVLGNSVRGNEDYGLGCFSDGPSAHHGNVFGQNGVNVDDDCINLFSSARNSGFCF